jgi:hypothetical protein
MNGHANDRFDWSTPSRAQPASTNQNRDQQRHVLPSLLRFLLHPHTILRSLFAHSAFHRSIDLGAELHPAEPPVSQQMVRGPLCLDYADPL